MIWTLTVWYLYISLFCFFTCSGDYSHGLIVLCNQPWKRPGPWMSAPYLLHSSIGLRYVVRAQYINLLHSSIGLSVCQIPCSQQVMSLGSDWHSFCPLSSFWASLITSYRWIHWSVWDLSGIVRTVSLPPLRRTFDRTIPFTRSRVIALSLSETLSGSDQSLVIPIHHLKSLCCNCTYQ